LTYHYAPEHGRLQDHKQEREMRRRRRGGKDTGFEGRRLGEARAIPRRDFVQGALVGAGSLLAGPLLLPPGYAQGAAGASAAAQDQPGYYPPTLTGMRGSHPGSFEAAHALRDGSFKETAASTGEQYDLIVVGAGISGLAAANFFRERSGARSRILILDNHDDFGGHAKRNEFSLAGHLHLMNGGTLEIDSPRPYSTVSMGLLRQLGIDVEALAREVEHPDFYSKLGLSGGAFFDRETFGADRLVHMEGEWFSATLSDKTLAQTPLSPAARNDLKRLNNAEVDYMPGLTDAQKKERLSRMSYRDYLLHVAKVDPSVAAFYQAASHPEWGVGIDAVAALELFAFGFPGFKGLKLTPHSTSRMGPTSSGYLDTGGSARLHFPDGNATIARLLVRRLVPEAVPGSSAKDVVTARVNYARLDRSDAPVRIRLSSTAVRVANIGGSTNATGVQVTYVRSGRAYTVGADRCVLAGYNMMIPYLCPELLESQKAALHRLVKTPLVYTTVALRNWTSFSKLGVSMVYSPGGYHCLLNLNPKVDIGSYLSVSRPEEPILLHMVRTPCKPGLPEHEQNKAGRTELLATPFATFEREIRSQLARILAPGGFDPGRDIEAITVNRWPHGYAPEWNPLFDPDVPEGQRSYVVGRARCGRITIANSDSGGQAYTDCAINQADRAVNELLTL
jgi:spermidine dehydrogenase